MELSFWAATDVGRKREHNEDNFLVDKKLSLFVVADGMGGHASGEVASHIAVHELRNAIEAKQDMLERFLGKSSPKAAEPADPATATTPTPTDPDVTPEAEPAPEAGPPVRSADILALLEQAVQAAGAAIFARGKSEPEKRGMGTTISALLLVGDRGFVAHVGDSRIYLVRQAQVIQLTEDHSLINELIRRGKVSKDGVGRSAYSAYKNAVTRAVGVYETVQVDTIDFDVLSGDQFLICTDGLHAYLDDDKLKELIATEEITSIPKHFIDFANEAGGQDNITAITLRVQQPADTAVSDARAEELTRKIEVLKQMPLFRHLTYKEIIRVLNLTEVADYTPGEDIMREGEPGDDLFILLRGRVRLHKDGAFITTILPGAHLGEMALVDRTPRSATATADEASRFLILRRQEFYEIMRKDPPLSVKLLWSFVQVLTDRLRKTTADLSGARQEADADDLTDDVLFDE
jgi:serine/threonine protein phosphatase PrpC